MAKGGKRLGAGRKKIGILINLRVQEEVLDEIYRCISGKTKAEKIRKWDWKSKDIILSFYNDVISLIN